MLEKVRIEVAKLLENENSGHGMEHINRVLNLSLRFAEKENANKDVVALIALLHDVDDYKIFGEENAKNLTNTKMIMNKVGVSAEYQEQVIANMQRIGYSKSLKGIRPETLEGKIVSDADMCDAIGVNGILRTYQYGLKQGRPFFDKNIFPVQKITVDLYASKAADTGVCHVFDKLLKLKGLMMTNAGKEEAIARHQIIVDCLYHLFDEEDATEWKEYLDNYLENLE